VPFSVIIASELWKLYLRHREKPHAPATTTEPPPETPAAEPA
jgi:hypothetical protein